MNWKFSVTTHPVNVAPLYHIEGTLTRDGFDWHCDDIDDDDRVKIPFAGAEVRVRFRFAAAEKAALDFDLVTAPFVGAKRIVTDPIAEHTRALRAPEVAQAQSIEQKVEAFIRAAGVAWTDGLQRKLAVLQAPDGAAFHPVVAEQPQEVCQ
jgi:hypothetical protein